MILKTSQALFSKELSSEEFNYWISFIDPIPATALRYAFENWNRNGRFFPKPKDIIELCEAYKLTANRPKLDSGCSRCDWSGFYETKREGYKERVVAQCPCVKNPTLREAREAHAGQGYGTNDMMWLVKRMSQEMQAKRRWTPAQLLDELDSKREGGAPEWRRA